MVGAWAASAPWTSPLIVRGGAEVVEEPGERSIEDIFERPLKTVKGFFAGQHGREAEVGFDYWRKLLAV